MPDFRRLWLVGLSVAIARWLEMLVVGVVVFQQTGSAFLVATMTLLRVAPSALLGLVSGVLADRVPRRSALLCILALQGGAVAAMALLASAGALQPWHVAIAATLSGIGWATDNPVRRVLVGEAVGPARIGAAMSLDVLSTNVSRIAGPLVGGLLLGAFGAGAAFGAAVALYLLAIAVAFGVRGGASASSRRGTSVLAEMRDGIVAALGLPRLRAVLMVTVIYNLFAWPCTSMIPVIGKGELGLGAGGVGLLASMEGIGALGAALVLGALLRPRLHAVVFLGGTALYLSTMVAFSLAPGPVPAGAALMASGLGSASFATMQGTLTWLVTPPELRGRALGMLSTAIGTGLVGFLLVGLLAEWLGAPTATSLVAGTGLLALAAAWPVWRALLRPD